MFHIIIQLDFIKFRSDLQEDPVIQSMGLKLEFNTRRFVTDDRRELQYRVEVQNRVYLREMVNLSFMIFN